MQASWTYKSSTTSRPRTAGCGYIALVDPKTRFVLALVGHQDNDGKPFSEFHAGLDHLEFLVDRREDLNEWAETLNRLGVEHSGVKEPDYTQAARLSR